MPLSMKKRYTADEFYNLDIAEPCELIDGYIYDMSPSPNIRHQRIAGEIFYTIKDYIKKNNGKCRTFSAPTDVKINDFTIVIPDIFVACNPDKFDEQKYNGAPDWVIEIVSPGNYAHDYKDKLLLYKNAGVREYWIIDPEEEKVLVYLFGTPNTTEFYSFDDEISAGIYRENDTPLLICVNELLK
ncbi:MAG: Uma2 family endonuclease [Oscillospiraceae bacterium]|nr:Uma2 family endonuclease [Oscillospiraceae bacterium]